MNREFIRQEGAAQPAAHECPQGYQQDAEKEALRMENLVRQSNLERAQQEYRAQGEELQRVMNTLEATRSQQQNIELLLDESENELAKCNQELAFLRFQLKGIPEQSQGLLPPPMSVNANQALVGPPSGPPPTSANSAIPFDSRKGASPTPPNQPELVESRWTRAANALFGKGESKNCESGSGYPTLAYLQADSSSAGLSSTPTLATTAGFADTRPSTDSRGCNAMAASAQPTVSTSQVTLTDLRKVKTTLPTLTMSGSTAFQLVRSWKEWTLNVGLHMG
eukprot:4791036-Amphidinium_carterae.1